RNTRKTRPKWRPISHRELRAAVQVPVGHLQVLRSARHWLLPQTLTSTLCLRWQEMSGFDRVNGPFQLADNGREIRGRKTECLTSAKRSKHLFHIDLRLSGEAGFRTNESAIICQLAEPVFGGRFDLHAPTKVGFREESWD